AGTLFVRLTNFSDVPTTAVLTAHANGQTVLSQSVELPASGSVPLEAPLPGGLGRLNLQLTAPGDALAVDNSGTLIEPTVRLLTVAVTLPDEEASMRLVQRVLRVAPDVQLGPVEEADLIIGPASQLPELADEQWW